MLPGILMNYGMVFGLYVLNLYNNAFMFLFSFVPFKYNIMNRAGSVGTSSLPDRSGGHHTIKINSIMMKKKILKTGLIASLAISMIILSCEKTPDNKLPDQPVPIDLTLKQVSLI